MESLLPFCQLARPLFLSSALLVADGGQTVPATDAMGVLSFNLHLNVIHMPQATTLVSTIMYVCFYKTAPGYNGVT